jgi:putative ATP-binding cassette transporter
MRNLGPVLADGWRLFKPYFFQSEEKRSALAMLIGIGVLSIAQTELGVLSTFWSNMVFNSFQQKDLHAFLALMFTWMPMKSGLVMPGFIILALLFIILGCLNTFVTQYLQIRWRNWMTGDFLRRWLADRAYYRISIASDVEGVATDNPDQRISDDLAAFCGAGANTRAGTDTLGLLVGFMSNVVSLFSYVTLLWVLSRGVSLFGVTVPGEFVWIALLFSVGSTVLTYLVGRPLIRLRFFQQRYEADFRFALVRVRESTEGIALHGGEADERSALLGSFGSIRSNFIGLLRRVLLLNVTTISYSQLASVLPQLLIAPLYFAGKATLGTMIQIGQAFASVQDSFSWFANNFPELAIWRATVGRLATFDRAVEAARAAGGRQFADQVAAGVGFRLDNVGLALPDGRPLVEGISAGFSPGIDTVITGRSGAGKSTLFRALAGIWPFGSGRIERPAGRSLFMPQRPYIPLGTLRHAVCYPLADGSVPTALVEQALEDADLAQLVSYLDDVNENWVLRLSGGEQQRLAIARALVVKPEWLFLDEATASLDPETEARMYGVLKRRLPETTIVSIAHNPAVAEFHRRRLVLGGAAGSLLAAE